MSRLDGANALALALAVIASVLGGIAGGGRANVRVEQIAPQAAELKEVVLAGGGRGLRDASGSVAELRSYQRIASASLVADHVLWELCAPERVIAVSDRSKHSARFGYRYAKQAEVGSPSELESIVALRPDLLFINHFGDPRYAARLRQHGITVFDLGEMHGMESLLPNIRAIGKLIGEPARADALAERLQARMRAVAADIADDRRPRALYLSAYGKQLYGGTVGTSYHDVLRYAGLHDLAAEHYRGWPTFDPEQVIALDPDVLVTKQGMARALCEFPGMQLLRACRGQARILELDAELADDPGLPMLDVAEQLRRAVHGEHGTNRAR